MDKAAKGPQDNQSAEKPVAVRSAKDVINAMYADKDGSGLGDYLAMSAREIVNATDNKKGTEAKSAANLHKHAKNQRIESVRTSASALMKMAESKSRVLPRRLPAADPIARKGQTIEVGPEKVESKASTVVRTSLKLKPKRPTVKAPSGQNPRPTTGIRAPKQRTPLDRVHTHNPQVFQDIVRPGVAKSAESTPGAKKAAQPSIVSQVGEKVKSISASSGAATDIKLKKSISSEQNEIEKPVLKAGTGSTHTAKIRPLDSIKKKFTPAPKGFAVNSARETQSEHAYQVEDYLNPSHVTKSVPATDDATHYYGLSENELAGNAKGVQVSRDQMAADAGLGVIEDHDSGGKKVSSEQPTVLRRDSADSNKYALNAQSPYYLKPEKEMKKRPLSGSGVPRVQTETATSVHAGQNLEEEIPKKNQYKRKKEPKSSKKSGKTAMRDADQPTMIIPARRKSGAPLVALLLLTVILGAVVGALAYLFFFQ